MHSVANLATLQIPLVTFCPFKKAPKPYFVSENRRYCSVRSCFPSTRLSLSLSVRQLGLAAEEQYFQLNTDTMLLL